ncbi:CheR family methyltransferase [Vulgatibacter sp.]|uniref:CheR family methyltransferase n=1 Tax=Vulgatibacter sp. TaxID=1971226 RepID=UPI0035679A33
MAERELYETASGARERGQAAAPETLEEIEVSLLLEGLWRHHGIDFRDYARASLKRRLRNALQSEKIRNVSQLQALVLHDPAALDRLLGHLSVHVTSLFRDPSFFRAIRERVVPMLRSHPFVRIWHAGCSTGEEVYSMAMLLEEEGLYDRCRIYATDMNAAVLEKARSGVFSLNQMKEYTANYIAAGGKRSLSDWYSATADHAQIKSSLRRNVVFAQHNLVTDGSFNEFHLVLCRNVMIYFNPTLQARVHRLIYGSLRRFGMLALGRREVLDHTVHATDYEVVDEAERIYRRIG